MMLIYGGGVWLIGKSGRRTCIASAFHPGDFEPPSVAPIKPSTTCLSFCGLSPVQLLWCICRYSTGLPSFSLDSERLFVVFVCIINFIEPEKPLSGAANEVQYVYIFNSVMYVSSTSAFITKRIQFSPILQSS